MAKKSQVEMPSGYRFLQDIMPDLNYVLDKRRSAKAYYSYFLNRVLEMFEYKNLPDTIPHEVLDKYLMINGIACITKDPDSQLRVFYGNLGGKQDCYYRPTKFIIANPHFKETFSKECVVLGDLEEHDGVLMRNDSCWQGLHAMLSRYSCLLAENTLTLRVSDVLLRITTMLSAPTDKEKVSAEEFLRSIENGELGVIAENAFFDGVKMQNPPSNNGSYLTQFIEYQQYLKGSFYNEVGLSANYNMKREAIGKGESTLDQDALLPLCENMLKTRREDLARVNEMFGTDISIDFSSSWKENMLEAKLTLLQKASEANLKPTSQLSEVDEVESGSVDESRSEIGQDEKGSEVDATKESSGTGADNSDGGSGDSSEAQDTGSNETEGETEDTGSDTDEAEGRDETHPDNINDLSQDAAFDELDKTLDESLSQLEVSDNMEGGIVDGSEPMDEGKSDSEDDLSGE